MDKQKAFLGGLSATLLFLSLLMIAPFIGYVLAAFILAFVLRPVKEKIEPFLGDLISTALVILIFISTIFAPFVLATGAVIDDSRDIIDGVGDMEAVDFTEIEELIFEWTSQDVDIEDEIAQGLQRFTEIAFGGITQFLDFLTGLAIGLTIMFFIMFYLIKDGDKMYEWLLEYTPMERGQQKELYSNASLMTKSILKGHVLVALVEGLIGGIAFYIVGLPNAAFWTFMMIVLAFIPVIGAFLVWAPAGAYLIITGDVYPGLFLLAYGLAVISPSDNILRPYLVDKRAEIHPAAVLIGVIGGVYVFGAVGLFIGPVIFGFTKTVLEVYLGED